RRQGRDPARKRVRRAPSPFLARRPLLRLQLGRARPERGLRAPFPHDRRGVARFDGRGAATEWSRDGKEIFFLTLDGRLMATPVSLGQTVTAGAPQALFATTLRVNTAANQYA